MEMVENPLLSKSSNKMNNKTLFLIFAVLLAIYGISNLMSNKTDRSFKTDLISIDTSQVTSLTIFPKSDDHQEILLQKNNGQWVATQGNVTTVANGLAVNTLLNNIQLIKTKRVAAKKEERWKDYEVDEANGTRIKVFAGSTLLEDFIVGRFSFDQQTRQGLSFIRISEEAEVYAVDGFMSMTLGQGFDAYRNKNLLKVNKEAVASIQLTKQDGSSQNFTHANSQWTKDNIAIDSTAMAGYLNGLQNVMGSDFADDVDETSINSLLYGVINIFKTNDPTPITLTCYQDLPKEKAYIFKSSQNTDAYFRSDESGLFKKLFVDLEGI